MNPWTLVNTISASTSDIVQRNVNASIVQKNQVLDIKVPRKLLTRDSTVGPHMFRKPDFINIHNIRRSPFFTGNFFRNDFFL